MPSYMGIFRSIYGETSRFIAQGKNKVYRLKKAISDLKQSPQAWFEKFNITISGIGFHRCHSDYFDFNRHIKSGIVILAVYLDDILLISSDSARLLETKEYLEYHFVTKDMRRPKYFLRIKVAH